MKNNDEPVYFRDTYRIRPARWPVWDYTNPGYYFVTICTKDRKNWFGEVVNEEVQLSEVGKIVDDEWKKTEKIRPYVILDSYVVMPNHFHGIVILGEQPATNIDIAKNGSAVVETPCHGVSTSGQNSFHNPQWQSGSLGSIIQQFKSACTKRIREMGCTDFHWQPRFYDRVIRHERETIAMRKYMATNPVMWENDDLFN